VIVDLCSDEEGSDYYAEADDGLLPALAPLRAELMCGDFRAAYLAWLLALQSGEVNEDATEPPLPPGLSSLTAAQRAMVELRVRIVVVGYQIRKLPLTWSMPSM
jgi:hypothetical protein